MLWMTQVFMIALMGVSILMFGNRFLQSIARVNLNGSSIDDVEGVVSQRLGQAAGLTVGLLAGGAGASMAGGSILKGAAMGGAAGARGGRPVTAAMVGLGVGKATAGEKTEDAEKQQHEYRMGNDPVYRARVDSKRAEQERKEQKEADRVMASSTAADADSWAAYATQYRDPSTGRIVHRNVPVPVPTDPMLREALEERGVEFRPTVAQMSTEAARGQASTADASVIGNDLGQQIYDDLRTRDSSATPLDWPPAGGSPLLDGAMPAPGAPVLPPAQVVAAEAGAAGAAAASAGAMAHAAESLERAARDVSAPRRAPARPSGGTDQAAALQRAITGLQGVLSTYPDAIQRSGQGIARQLEQARDAAGQPGGQETSARLLSDAASRMEQVFGGTSNPQTRDVLDQVTRLANQAVPRP